MYIRILIKYLVLWILISIGYFFISETVTNWLFPNVHGVETWLIVLSIGLIIIFIVIIISLIRGLRRLNRKNKFRPAGKIQQ